MQNNVSSVVLAFVEMRGDDRGERIAVAAVKRKQLAACIDDGCIVRQATEGKAAVYGRAVSCDSQALMFNTYSESRCIIPNV